jgi:hypothetical protein
MNPIAHPVVEEQKQTRNNTLSVCVLDRDAVVVEMLEESINEFGYAAHGTADPGEALEQIRKRVSRHPVRCQN